MSPFNSHPTLRGRIELAYLSAKSKLWDTRQVREQRILLMLGILIVSVLSWKFIWVPSELYEEQAKLNYSKINADQVWLVGHPPKALTDEQPLEQKSLSKIITDTALDHHITINSLTLESDSKARLHTSQVSYRAAIEWLYMLENRCHLTLEELEINKVSEGVVEIKMTAVRGLN